MNSSPNRGRKIPPYAEDLPARGTLYCCLSDWKLGAAWPRFIIPRGWRAREYRLDFVRNRNVVVMHRVEEDAVRIAETVEALVAAGASRVVAMPPVRCVQ